MCYNNYAKRPVGQAVKTLASHAGNMGSIPVRVTKKKSTTQSVVLFFLVTRPRNRPAAIAAWVRICAVERRACLHVAAARRKIFAAGEIPGG